MRYIKGKTDTSSIRWVNDCEFILTPVNPESILDQYQIHMKIMNTTENTYTFQYNIVGETQKETGSAERRLSNFRVELTISIKIVYLQTEKNSHT